MALPTYPNPISFSQIRSGFATAAKKFSELYKKDAGPVYTGQVGYPFGSATEVPSSGPIRMSNFSGAEPYTPIPRSVTFSSGSGNWVVPKTLISDITVLAIGGGGGGAGWPSQAGGGGGGGGSRYVGRPAADTVLSYSVGAGGSRGSGGNSGAGGGSSSASISGVFSITANGGGGGVASGDGGVYASGGTGNYGNGGNGSSRSGVVPAGNATTLGGGGGSFDYGYADSGRGLGAGGGGNGGTSRTSGSPPGGGGGGGDTGTGGNGADGAVIISGVW